MRSGALSTSSVTLAVAGVGVGAWVALMPLADVTLHTAAGATLRDTTSYAVPPVDSLVRAIVPRDPFRVTRRPATIVYDPVIAAQPPAPLPPKPALVLTGIVWGAHDNPSAVLDGLPGGAGPRVVREGEQVGALRVRHIARDRVVVAGMDTVWTLTVKEPWK